MCNNEINSFKRTTQMIYTVEQIKRTIQPVIRKYGVTNIFLFGSYACGTARTDSDIDLFVDISGSALTDLFSLGALRRVIPRISKACRPSNAGFFGADSPDEERQRFSEPRQGKKDIAQCNSLIFRGFSIYSSIVWRLRRPLRDIEIISKHSKRMRTINARRPSASFRLANYVMI